MPSGLKPDPPWEAERAALDAELIALQKQQQAALERATYIRMSAAESQEYEHRSLRIAELQRTLGRDPDTPQEP
jgi:hypothetical protein